MKLVKSLVLVAILGLGALQGASFKVDVSHSDIAFKVKHMMISNVKGHFEKFDGTFRIDAKTKIFSKLEGSVEVASISTKETKRDDHLKSDAFFDAKKYPLMKLKLIEHDGDTLKVALTIKDVTKVITMEVEDISGIVKDPWGQTKMAFELHAKINRKDFNINFNQLLETGGLLVGDKIKIDIIIEGTMVK